ncbi:MAG: DUF502 domain-containing protein [Verrucomicrobiota bacterium]
MNDKTGIITSSFAWLRDKLIVGLFIVLPIAITVWILHILYSWINGPLDNVIRVLIHNHLIPASNYFIDYHDGTIPGAGFLLTLILLIIIGVLVENWLGKRLLLFVDSFFQRIPVVRPVYGVIKQAFEAFQNMSGGNSTSAFRQVVYVPYPFGSAKLIAFVTNRVVRPNGDVDCYLFLPTAPSPLTGFVLILPEKELIPCDLTVEQATKLILSFGLVSAKS